MVKKLMRLLGSNISATRPVFREYGRPFFHAILNTSVWHHGPSGKMEPDKRSSWVLAFSCSYGQKTQSPLMKYRETPPPNFQKQI